MSHHIIEFDKECQSCGGTGLYKGMAERDGFAVVCHTCKGQGHYKDTIEYDDFEGRRIRENVAQVLEVNPGIVAGTGANEYTIDSFGGMSYEDWLACKPFPQYSEMRRFTCPAWWYQIADYDKKPRWDWCVLAGAFERCSHFGSKAKCWARWDREYGEAARLEAAGE